MLYIRRVKQINKGFTDIHMFSGKSALRHVNTWVRHTKYRVSSISADLRATVLCGPCLNGTLLCTYAKRIKLRENLHFSVSVSWGEIVHTQYYVIPR